MSALRKFLGRFAAIRWMSKQWRADHWGQWRRRRTERRLLRISSRLAEHYQQTVAAGPFKGMHYVTEAFCGGYAPKLLGCYEAELHPVIDAILRRPYVNIVDVGTAEGYYAVGLARHFPRSHVWGFELVPHARELCAELARLNGVADRVHLQGACDAAALNSLPLGSGSLLICDCEGAEIDILDPLAAPALTLCDLLVEMHDCYNPLITPTLLARFGETHDCTLVSSASHDPEAFPAAHFLPRKDRPLAVDDLRSESMQWGFFTVKPVPANGQARKA
jgi:hypothetical protein